MELRHRMVDAIARKKAPSVSVAWVSGDGPVVVEAAGRARIAPAEDAAVATPYPWFSATKLFTATAVLQLIEAGKFALDDPIAKVIPTSHPFTVRQLLSHTSGLANPIPVSWVHLVGERGPTLDELTSRLLRAHPKLRFAPGTRFAYSNLNYLVLGQLIERASGERYETYLVEHVLRPLGAAASGFTVSSGTATGYSRRWSMMGIAARWMLDRTFFGDTSDGYTALRPFVVDGAPYGGLVGPASDLLRLGRAMLDRGTIDGRTVVRPETVDVALAPTKATSGAPLPIGLGWHLGAADGEPYAHHLGGGGGFRSELRIYPRLRSAIAIIANETSFDTGSLAKLIVADAPRTRSSAVEPSPPSD